MLVGWLVALQGVPEAEGSFFQYKCPQTPHFAPKKKKKKGFSRQFWADSLSLLSLISLPNTSKHIKTPSNTLDSHLFSTIFMVVFLHLIFLSLIPYLFLFIAFSSFFLLNNRLLLLFLACSCFLAYLHSFSSMFPCFCHDLPLCCCWPSLLGLGNVYFSCLCLDAHVLGSFPCLCLDLHAYVLFAMFLLRSTC